MAIHIGGKGPVTVKTFEQFEGDLDILVSRQEWLSIEESAYGDVLHNTGVDGEDALYVLRKLRQVRAKIETLALEENELRGRLYPHKRHHRFASIGRAVPA